MDRLALTEEIVSLDCELNVYRKGCLLVSLNLQHGTMIWRNSCQWCNNFIRSLTADQVFELRSLIQSLDLKGHLAETTDPAEGASEPPAMQSLKLTAVMANRQLSFVVEPVEQDNWPALRREIEKLSRVPFQL